MSNEGIKWEKQRMKAQLNEQRVLALLQRDARSYSEIRKTLNLSDKGLADILKRLIKSQKIIKIGEKKQAKYQLTEPNWYNNYYLEHLVSDIFGKDHRYWHDDLEQDSGHTPLIQWIKGIDGFAKKDWVSIKGIRIHILNTIKDRLDDDCPVYPNVPEFIQNALDQYMQMLKEINKDTLNTNNDHKLVITFEFDFSQIIKDLSTPLND